MHRLANRVLPRVRSTENLRDLVFRLKPTELDARWIASLDGMTIERCAALMATPRSLLLRAAHLIALRLGAIGTSPEILQLRPTDDLLTSPFAELATVVTSIELARARGTEAPDWQPALARCRVALDQVSAVIDDRGAPSTTLFRHELLGTLLTRLAVLLHVALDTGAVPARELGVLMTNAVVEDESLEAIGRAQTKRLALKITEYTGVTGEHYVARNRREYWGQLRAGAYGGCVTAFTALLKFGLSALPLAPVVLAMGLAANYTISFWILQIFHFALSSKQPAMTASALATSLADKSNMEHNIELIAAISRSQAAVTVSNVGATVALSLLLDFLFHQLTGRYFLSTETAEHALRGINPVLTLTALYAAITGVFLWLSSLAAGAAANWIAYRQLAEATREDSPSKAGVREGFREATGGLRRGACGWNDRIPGAGVPARVRAGALEPVLRHRARGAPRDPARSRSRLRRAAAPRGRRAGAERHLLGIRRHRGDRLLQLHRVGVARTAHGSASPQPGSGRALAPVEGNPAGVPRASDEVLLGTGARTEEFRDAYHSMSWAIGAKL